MCVCVCMFKERTTLFISDIYVSICICIFLYMPKHIRLVWFQKMGRINAVRGLSVREWSLLLPWPLYLLNTLCVCINVVFLNRSAHRNGENLQQSGTVKRPLFPSTRHNLEVPQSSPVSFLKYSSHLLLSSMHILYGTSILGILFHVSDN